MKKFSKRLFTSLVAFCMLFAVSAVPAFAAETTTEITDTQQPVVIGEYDGYLTDVMISDGVTKEQSLMFVLTLMQLMMRMMGFKFM